MIDWAETSCGDVDAFIRLSRDSHEETALGGAGRVRTGTCDVLDLRPIAYLLREGGARLQTVSAIRHGEELELTYSFGLVGGNTLMLRTLTQGHVVPSLSADFVAADFLEREVNALFDVTFVGHEQLLCVPPARRMRLPSD